MFGSDVSYLFTAETKKPLDAETPLLCDARYGPVPWHVTVILNVFWLDHCRLHRSKPQALLNSDGDQLMNLWFIPHITEVYTICVYYYNVCTSCMHTSDRGNRIHVYIRIVSAISKIQHPRLFWVVERFVIVYREISNSPWYLYA